MAIDPTTTTTVKVSELASAGYNTTDLIPHEVAGILKKGNLQDLATFIGGIISTEGAVGFRAVTVTDGQTLPATTEEEFILVGPGTYPNVGGGSAVTTTEPLNALVSNGTYWFIGVEIPISASGAWGSIAGEIENQADLMDALDLKADLVDGKVPSSQLPSYVDDVVEVANYAALPATGETGKIYITIDTNKVYRWSGSAYIEIAADKATWGLIEGTLSNQNDLQNALNAKFNNPTGNTTQYIAGDGSLITFPTAGQAGTLVREVRNTTGSTLTKGTIVYISGATGNKPTVSKAIATGDSTSAQTFGMVQADISNNANGYVVCIGDITGLNTSAITEGSQLYLSSTTAGTYTTTKQLAPAHLVYIGVVTRSHATLGQIEVKIQNGYELDELHDVAISSKTNKDFLVYESSTDLWKNKSLGTIVGGTSSQFIKGDGSLDSTVYALDNTVVKITTNQNVKGIKTFLGDQTATTLKLIVADYYNDGFITSDNGMLRLLNGTTELFNLASTGDLTAKSFVKTGGTASQFLKANGTVDSTTYLSGTVAIANGGTGATTADAALTNLGGTTVGKNIFTSTNPSPVTTAYLKVKPDNSVEWLEANAFRIAIGAGTGNGTVTSVEAVGGYGGLTLTGTVTGSGQLTLGGTPEGNWPINITGNASSVNTVLASTNADFYLTFVDSGNGSPQSDFLYTVGSIKVNPSTGALTAGSFVKSGGTSSQYLMADGSVSTGGGGTVTGTGTTNYIPKFTGASAIGNSLIYDNGTNVGIGTSNPALSNLVISPIIGTGTVDGLTVIYHPDGGSNRLRAKLWINDFNGQLDLKDNGDIQTVKVSSGGNSYFNGGNVGIGTSSPSALLQVLGINTLTANTRYLKTQIGGAVNWGLNSFEELAVGYSGIRSIYTGGDNWDLSFAAGNSTSFTNGTQSERMRITSGGNVGIGTTSPSAKLDVINNTTYQLRLASSSSSYANGGLYLGALGTADANYYGYMRWIQDDITLRIGSQHGNSSGGITFFTGEGTAAQLERMRITSGGEVQIKSGSADTVLSFINNASGAARSITYGVSTAAINITGTSGSPQVTILNGGNVGIGTTSPITKLHVDKTSQTIGGTTPNGGLVITNLAGSNYALEFGTDTSLSPWIQSRNAASASYYNLLLNPSGGNVGIGTTSPSTKLDVVGAITASGGFFNSDMRLKDLTDYDYNVSDIKPITYLWKDGRDDKKHVGYSAQEVQKVMPDAVNEGTDGMLSVNYVEILVAKISQMEKEIAYLKSKI